MKFIFHADLPSAAAGARRLRLMESIPFHRARRAVLRAPPWHGGASDGFHYPPFRNRNRNRHCNRDRNRNRLHLRRIAHPRAKSGCRRRKRSQHRSLSQHRSRSQHRNRNQHRYRNQHRNQCRNRNLNRNPNLNRRSVSEISSGKSKQRDRRPERLRRASDKSFEPRPVSVSGRTDSL